MASIHKDPRGKSPFFYCAFTLPNGKRCFKSTKLTDRSAAMEFCLRMDGAARKAAAHNFSEEHARKILNEIRKLSGDSAIRFKSLGDYSEEWLRSKEVTTSEETFVRYSGFVKDFVAHVGKQRAGASVEAVTPLLSDSSQVSNRIRRNYSIHISLDREVSSMKSGAQLIAAILAAGLGVITVVTGHIGSGTVREMQANGVAARFVGVLLFIMRR